MNVQKALFVADRVSTWAGKATAWLIIALMLVVCIEVFKRYILNSPDAWIYDINNMMYGTLFMMCGAYTLSCRTPPRSSMSERNFSGRSDHGRSH